MEHSLWMTSTILLALISAVTSSLVGTAGKSIGAPATCPKLVAITEPISSFDYYVPPKAATADKKPSGGSTKTAPRRVQGRAVLDDDDDDEHDRPDQPLHSLSERGFWPVKKPAATPAPTLSQEEQKRQDQVRWMLAQRERIPSVNRINAYPSPAQMHHWRVPTDEGVDTVYMSVTGEYHAWPSDTERWWVMGPLSGCTAVFVVSEEGFWGAHFWEASAPPSAQWDSGGAFMSYKDPTCRGGERTTLTERTPEEFKKVACDPLHKPDSEYEGSFISLADVARKHNDPFRSAAGGSGVAIAIVTPDASTRQVRSAAEYHQGLIDVLVNEGLCSKTGKGAVPKAKVSRATYKKKGYLDYDDPLRRLQVAGTMLVQWTPRDEKRMARVRIWNDDKMAPVLDRAWRPKGGG